MLPFTPKKNPQSSSRKYPKIVCYFHNMAAFDGYFLFECILQSCLLSQFFNMEKNVKIFQAGGLISKIQFFNLFFLDSYLMTRTSLKKLGNLFETSQKGEFDVKNNSYVDFQKIFQNSEKYAEFLAYNVQDSLTLYQCMIKLRKEFFDFSKIDFSEAITASSLGKLFFRMNYYRLPGQIFLKREVLQKMVSSENDILSENNQNSYKFQEVSRFFASNKRVDRKTAHHALF